MASRKKSTGGVLHYQGCNFLRQRIILSTLSGRAVRITNIRTEEDDPGIRGTSLMYKPGLLLGGAVEHDCSCQRSIGYYLEAVILLAPFCKKPLNLTLRGITNDQNDPSVDIIKYVTLAILKKFIIDDDVDLKINKRGAAPDGGGEIFFKCPVRRNLRPAQFVDCGKIKRIRGTAYTMKVSPGFASRMVDSCRGILNQFVSDIYIYTDHCKGVQSGNCPGFGISLMAESTSGAMLSAEFASSPKGDSNVLTPEEIGKQGALRLVEEIFKGGYVDTTHQSLVLLFMALGQMDISKVLLGPLTRYSIQLLRHLKDFFNVMYKIEAHRKDADDESRTGSEEKYTLSCLGVGFTNISKTAI
eukprot:gene8069-8932_t